MPSALHHLHPHPHLTGSLVSGSTQRNWDESPSLNLSNRFSALPADVGAHPADFPIAGAPPDPDVDPPSEPDTAVTAAARALSSPAATWSSTGATPKVPILSSSPDRREKRDAMAPIPPPPPPVLLTPSNPSSPPFACTPASSWQNKLPGKSSSFSCRLLKEAVSRRSGGLIRPQPPEEQPPELVNSSVTVATEAAAATAVVDLPSSAAAAAPSSSAANPTPAPLFPITALTVGDSIVSICFANAATHCFPGATAADILDKLPRLLESAPPTITKVIIHCGSNDTTHRQTELTKVYFRHLFKLLNSCGKSVFFLWPTPHVRSWCWSFLQDFLPPHLAPNCLRCS
ncbi:hypothetical protein ABVT39_021388 [Epinephelus coioides]